ncbi:uncharacterized protein PG998_010278 [Apiospora kogelbergensis]|uniref:uncharacterized protein n=1 Tax=Apiospora kogelbergensis TaxID=1337665 RepID=UPI0031310429
MAGYPLSDTLKTLSLTLLSILLLPLSLFTLCLGYIAQYAFPKASTSIDREAYREDARDQRTILVTGVGMAKGLTLARAFHLSGHRVIGADFESPGIPCSGKSSSSLSAFYRMPKPDHAKPGAKSKSGHNAANAYVERLVDIVKTDGVDLWVSCSGVASAAEDAEAKEAIERRTACRCIQFDVATTTKLHEKDRFMRETARLGLPCPETHTVTSPRELLRILDASSSSAETSHEKNREPREFILKPVGVDDAHRGDMTRLPLATRRATERHVARLPAAPGRPWIAQRFVPGGAEYCTHALVVRGRVRCFAACASAELLMHYRPLAADSALSRAMLRFTREFVARYAAANSDGGGGGLMMTGHLSFDFMVAEDGEVTEKGFRRSLYAIECNPRAHTAVVLFAQPGPEMRDMVRAYLSAIEPKGANGSTAPVANGFSDESKLVTPPRDAQSRYWIGHDLVSLVVHPTYRLATGRITLHEFLSSLVTFLSHLLTWKEGTWEAWDPWPAVVLYHAYWPLSIIDAWRQGQRWSRVNVSTTKMFNC